MAPASNKLSTHIGGKAAGLNDLSAIEGINVPAYVNIPADADHFTRARLVKAFISAHPDAGTVAVRSSALKEDSETASYAGAFETHLNVPLDKKLILDAVNDVRDKGERKLADVFNAAAEKSIGVVVQRMIDQPDFAGVCLSQGYGDEDSAYILVNFRAGLGDQLVGGGDNGVTLKILRNASLPTETVEKYPFLPQLVAAIQKIENAKDGAPMDTEFAFKDSQLFMLQARPLIAEKIPAAHRSAVEAAVNTLQAQVSSLPANDLFCDMSDINPRELLGQDALPVNISIFRHMFADRIVEEARAGMGYAPLYQGLLHEIGGKPYVSLRTAAHSMRPEGISADTYDKLVGVYVDQVRNNHNLQDRVEFDVFITGAGQVAPFLAAHIKDLPLQEQREILRGFQLLDASLLTEKESFCATVNDQVADYTAKAANLHTDMPLADILDTLTAGTALFVRAARLAFYQKKLCSAFPDESLVTVALTSLDTPTERLQHSLLMQEDLAVLTREYGHLRPGQMNIFATPYRDDIAKNLDHARYADMPAEERDAQLRSLTDRKDFAENTIDALPEPEKTHAIHLRALMAARENVKHAFMRAYDIVAQKIDAVAQEHGFSPEQTGRMRLEDVLALEQNPAFALLLSHQLNSHQPQPALLLPGVLSQQTQLSCLEITAGSGTYFGKGAVSAAPLIVTEENIGQLTRADVAGKILIMDHADPGYDFLLLFQPAGIVTRIGGPASHIAIRVNELGIPSCIGSGIDPLSVDSNREYVIDCVNKRHGAGKDLPKPDGPSSKRSNNAAAAP